MKKIIISLFAISTLFNVNANNVVITSVTTSGQDVTAGLNNASNYSKIEFDINWDNSWRVSTGANNWDAVWVFAKFKIETGGSCTSGPNWKHCSLSTADGNHIVTTTNGVAATIDAAADGKGVFLYRSANGNGSINWDDIKLQWNYIADGLSDNCKVTVQVFAIEMVYVPTGSFNLGDGSASTSGSYRQTGVALSTFNVSSDGAIVIGGGTAGALGRNSVATSFTDDWTEAVAPTSAPVTVPASFPVGYSAFYGMKYEISQQQYAEFLNTLTGTQQAARTSAITVGSFHSTTPGTMTPVNRNGVKCKNAPVGVVPGEYVCDLDDDDIFNETSSDGFSLACNWVSCVDLMAYLDWSALRPMTETEFEKSCRGGGGPGLANASVADEFAWGTSTRTLAVATDLINGGNATETFTTVNANAIGGNSSTGPSRCGVFATGVSTRIASGAGYYGSMNLSDNVLEDVVLIGCAAGRSYTGINGDGLLNTAGAANVDFWPGINGNNTPGTANGVSGGTTGCTGRAGISYTGGSYVDGNWQRTSDRSNRGVGHPGSNFREARTAGRGVRSE